MRERRGGDGESSDVVPGRKRACHKAGAFIILLAASAAFIVMVLWPLVARFAWGATAACGRKPDVAHPSRTEVSVSRSGSAEPDRTGLSPCIADTLSDDAQMNRIRVTGDFAWKQVEALWSAFSENFVNTPMQPKMDAASIVISRC